VEGEWAAVPGRLPSKLAAGADQLEPLAKVTKRFGKLSLFTENDLGEVPAAAGQLQRGSTVIVVMMVQGMVSAVLSTTSKKTVGANAVN
jgi:hypothetical protein